MTDRKPQHDRCIDVWLAFLRAHSRVTAVLERELEAAEDLPMSWFDVLEQLRQAPEERLRMQELGERLAMSASGLSRRVSRMEQAGLVERQPCPDDRRGVLVVLTRSGKRRYRRALPVHLRGVDAYFLDHIHPDEAKTIKAVFERMLCELEDRDQAEANPAQAASGDQPRPLQ